MSITFKYKPSLGPANSSSAEIQVSVTDIDEAPNFTTASYYFFVDENTTGNSPIISLNPILATDPEGGVVRYTLLDLNGDPYSGALFELPNNETTSTRRQQLYSMPKAASPTDLKSKLMQKVALVAQQPTSISVSTTSTRRLFLALKVMHLV